METLISIFQASRTTLIHLQIFGLYSETTANNLFHTLKVEPFQSVCRPDISYSEAFETWPQIVKTLPSLTILHIELSEYDVLKQHKSLVAMGACV